MIGSAKDRKGALIHCKQCVRSHKGGFSPCRRLTPLALCAMEEGVMRLSLW